jgi:hypothetical protein
MVAAVAVLDALQTASSAAQMATMAATRQSMTSKF